MAMAILRRALLALAACMVLSGAARAADAPLSAFVGEFLGSGIAETKMPGKVAVTARDLDVAIAAEGEGFTVKWTAIEFRVVPGSASSQRRTETVTFVPAGRKGLFKATTEADPAAGPPLLWARIVGNTLTVFRLTITDRGDHEVSTWARSVQGDRMDLVFRRVVAGEPTRIVRGSLARSVR